MDLLRRPDSELVDYFRELYLKDSREIIRLFRETYRIEDKLRLAYLFIISLPEFPDELLEDIRKLRLERLSKKALEYFLKFLLEARDRGLYKLVNAAIGILEKLEELPDEAREFLEAYGIHRIARRHGSEIESSMESTLYDPEAIPEVAREFEEFPEFVLAHKEIFSKFAHLYRLAIAALEIEALRPIIGELEPTKEDLVKAYLYLYIIGSEAREFLKDALEFISEFPGLLFYCIEKLLSANRELGELEEKAIEALEDYRDDRLYKIFTLIAHSKRALGLGEVLAKKIVERLPEYSLEFLQDLIELSKLREAFRVYISITLEYVDPRIAERLRPIIEDERVFS